MIFITGPAPQPCHTRRHTRADTLCSFCFLRLPDQQLRQFLNLDCLCFHILTSYQLDQKVGPPQSSHQKLLPFPSSLFSQPREDQLLVLPVHMQQILENTEFYFLGCLKSSKVLLQYISPVWRVKACLVVLGLPAGYHVQKLQAVKAL